MASSDYFGIVDNQIINYKKYMPKPVDVVFHSRTSNIFFEDNGVSNDYNSNYTDLQSGITTTVGATGTTLQASGYGDKFRKANALISGDFEIKYTCVSATSVFGAMRFLSTSNTNLFTVEQYQENTILVGNTEYPIGEVISFPFTMTIIRVGTKLTVWYNDIQVATDVTVSDSDGYFAWKLYGNDGRSQTFKNLTIKSNKKINVYYDDNKIIEQICNDLGDIELSFDVFDDVYWTGYNKTLRITSQLGNEIVGEGRFTVHEINGTLKESVEYIANYLAEILTEKGVPSTYDEGLTSLIYKVKDISGFNPHVKTNTYQNLYRIDGVYNGGYNKGFYNGLSDWEFTATIDTNNSECGFCLFAYPYPYSYCNCGETNPWDCIYKNGRGDILQFKDGYIKTNTGSNLVSTGIRYSYSSSLDVKFVKIGNTINYFENDVFIGNYEWDALASAERIYPGQLNWVSTNRSALSNLGIRRL